MQSQRWKSFQSLTGRESHLSCRAVTFNSTNEKKLDIFNELTSWRKRKHARTAVLVIQVMEPSSQQGGRAPRATRETNSYLLRMASRHCFSPRLVALADPELTISTGPPSKPDTMHGKDSSRCFVNK